MSEKQTQDKGNKEQINIEALKIAKKKHIDALNQGKKINK